MNSPANSKTLRAVAVTQFIAFTGCVIVPGLVTLIAPRSTVELKAINDLPSAEIKKHLFLVIPLFKKTIAPLERAESIVTQEDRTISSEERRRGRVGVLLADGSVLLSGGGEDCQVQSTPAAARQEAKAINEFIAAPRTSPQTLTLTAGWQMTYLLGGAMTALAMLYCLGVLASLLKWFVNLVQPLK
jgi:hypothetical protein